MKTVTIQISNDAYYELEKEARLHRTSPRVIAQARVTLYPKEYRGKV